MTINFEIIGKKIHKFFDSDLMDIKRNGIEIYSNIPCNIQINSADNPDPTAIDVTPIISSLTIHMDNYVDIQNNDYIIAKRMSHNKEILEVYRGVCGFPSVWQSRKSVTMAMNTLSNDGEVTPPPPLEQSIITINYKDLQNEVIKPETSKIAEVGKQVDIFPPAIDGYTLKNSYLDGELQADLTIIIPEAKAEGHNVLFEYETTQDITYLRILVNGVYTKDNGSLGYGYHLYKKIPILSVIGSNGNYVLKTSVNKVLHDDNGELKLTKGTKLKLYNSKEWVEIVSEATAVTDGYEFETQAYTPTEAEENAVETNWYEVTR